MIKRLLHNSFWKDISYTTIGQIILMLIAFAINKVVCNFLSIEDFAIFNLIRRTASVITYLMLMAMGIAVPKYLAMAKEKNDAHLLWAYLYVSVQIVLTMTSFLTIILAVGKRPFASIVFGEEALNYSHVVIPMIIYAAGSSLTSYVYSYYRAVGEFVKFSISQLGVQAAMLSICFVTRANLKLLIYFWGIGSCLYAIVSLSVFLKRHYVSRGEVDGALLASVRKELLAYGIPRVPGEFFLFAYNLVPLIIVTRKFGLEYSSYFSVATSINSTITSLFGFVGIVLLPEVSKALANKEIAKVSKRIRYLFLIYIALALLAILFVELLPSIVVNVLYSSEYEVAIPIIRIIVIGVLPNAIYLLLRNPVDAISAFPFNTICLGISFAFMIIMMIIADSILACEVIYIVAYIILGGATAIVWNRLSSNYKKA